jgi:hypothetical protein
VCGRETYRIVAHGPRAGDVEFAKGAAVTADYRGPLGAMPVSCPRGHRFVSGTLSQS